MSLRPSPYTIASLLAQGVEILNTSATLAGLDIRMRYECEILLSHILDKERVYLHTHCDELISSESTQCFLEAILLRAKGKPLEYLTKSVSFYGCEFGICEGVLIPRPETELLVDKASRLITHFELHQIAEVGVGSGVVSISLALLLEQSYPKPLHFIATDINPTAIKLTSQNIATHTPNAQIELFNCSMLECLQMPNPPFFKPQIIISNPPYIAQDYSLPTPLTYEPREALFSGDDGLCALRELIEIAKRLKTWLVCEIGYDQKAALMQILKSNNAHEVEFYKDYSGFDRGFWAKF